VPLHRINRSFKINRGARAQPLPSLRVRAPAHKAIRVLVLPEFLQRRAPRHKFVNGEHGVLHKPRQPFKPVWCRQPRAREGVRGKPRAIERLKQRRHGGLEHARLACEKIVRFDRHEFTERSPHRLRQFGIQQIVGRISARLEESSTTVRTSAAVSTGSSGKT